MKFRLLIAALLLLLFRIPSYSQIRLGDDLSEIDYTNPQEYIIGGVTISGVQYLDHNVLIMLSGLQVADRIEIPGDKIRKAIKNCGIRDCLKTSAFQQPNFRVNSYF